MTINTTLIAEYLALAHNLPEDGTALEYRRVNQLAFQLAMDLPADMWRAITRTFQPKAVSGVDTGQAIWEALFAARYLNGLGRELTLNDCVHHAPGAGRPRDPAAPGDPGSNVMLFPGVPHAQPERDRSPEPPAPHPLGSPE